MGGWATDDLKDLASGMPNESFACQAPQSSDDLQLTEIAAAPKAMAATDTEEELKQYYHHMEIWSTMAAIVTKNSLSSLLLLLSKNIANKKTD